jgi:hypothetical protein
LRVLEKRTGGLNGPPAVLRAILSQKPECDPKQNNDPRAAGSIFSMEKMGALSPSSSLFAFVPHTQRLLFSFTNPGNI